MGAVVAIVAFVWASVQIGYRWANRPVALDPWVVLFGVLDGSVSWLPQVTIAAAILGVTLAVSVLSFGSACRPALPFAALWPRNDRF